MKNMYLGINLTLFLLSILMYAPAQATEIFRPPNLPFLTTLESPARMYKAGQATTTEITLRKLRFREKLVLHLLKNKGFKSHVSFETKIKNRLVEEEDGSKMNKASLALGLVGAITLILGASAGSPILVLLGLPAAIIGLILGIRGVVKRYPKWGMGIAGTVLAGAGLTGLLVVIWNFLNRYE